MFESIAKIIEYEKKDNIPFWKCIQNDDCKENNMSKEESFTKMLNMYKVMKEADKNYNDKLYSQSGLVGTDGKKLKDARERGDLICGNFIGKVMERAVKMAESNACMKRIVASPTAGSCGVIPAVFITAQETLGYSDEEMTKAMYVAAGIGEVIASRAFLAGAAGGCQAEIGSASSMAAGALCYLRGGDGVMIANAAALAMKSLLGLACDPVAGLVEVPCVKRNVIGAVNAMTASDMAYAGIESKIPPDEVFDAMRTIGKSLPEDIKETGKGGLAATPTGIAIKKKISF